MARDAGRHAGAYVHVEPEPTEETRFGLYVQDRDGLHRVAETDKDGIGAALAQLAEDRREVGGSDTEIIGVLDRIERKWLTGLWPKGGIG